MSAYLKYYALENSPFEGEASSKVVLGTKALRDALEMIREGLEEGAARICVDGSPGLGKTSLARALPKLLKDEARVAVVLDPADPWETLRHSIAKQWKIGAGGLARSSLLEAVRETRLVVVIDQAETAPADLLDHLDVLLSYRTESDEPVVQSVLFANLSLANESSSGPLGPSPVLWWLDRIQTLQLEFQPLPREGVKTYVQKHLKRAGWRGDEIFSEEASHAIHGYTGGNPREIGLCCERLLEEAAQAERRNIDADFVHAILESDLRDGESLTGDDSTVANEFEDLVGEEEFEGAERGEDDVQAVRTSLEKTLEHFSGPEPIPLDSPMPESDLSEPVAAVYAEHDDHSDDEPRDTLALGLGANVSPMHADIDADGMSVEELDAYLSRPATEDELRALQGHGLSRMMRMAAMLIGAIAIGAVAISWLRTDSRDEIDVVRTPAAETNPTPPLAKLRGPVYPAPTADQTEDSARVAGGDSTRPPTTNAPARVSTLTRTNPPRKISKEAIARDAAANDSIAAPAAPASPDPAANESPVPGPDSERAPARNDEGSGNRP